MSAFRRAVGALAGGLITAAALRTRQLARQRNAPLLDVVGDLPVVLREDAERLSRDVRNAIADGRQAAEAKEADIERAVRTGPEDSRD